MATDTDRTPQLRPNPIPWVGQHGMGTQYELPDEIERLLASGHSEPCPTKLPRIIMMKIVRKSDLSRAKTDFDGPEDEFIRAALDLQCPTCEGQLIVRPSESRSAFFEVDEVRVAIAEFIKSASLKESLGEKTLYFGNLRGSTQRVCCPKCSSVFVLVWAIGEVQPGRFRATFKGALIE